MTRQTPFQMDRPLFVRIPFRAGTKDWKKGREFPWREMAMDNKRVMILYTQGFLHHNDELEKETRVGDGLEALTREQLHDIVDNINKKVKEKTKTDAEFQKKKCKKSSLKDKQIGLLRSWRRNFGYLDNGS